MTDEFFGDIPEDPTDKPFRVALPLRPLNLIEHELNAKFIDELRVRDAPVPFIDDDGSLENADDYVKHFGRDDLTTNDVMTVRYLIEGALIEKYRMQLIIARELGETRHNGGPSIEEYRAACAAENVDPLL